MQLRVPTPSFETEHHHLTVGRRPVHDQTVFTPSQLSTSTLDSMTSGTAPKPSAAMASASRQSRFSNFAMANGTDKTSQPIGTSYQGTAWKPGLMGESIWTSSSGIGSFGKRDAAASRGSYRPGEQVEHRPPRLTHHDDGFVGPDESTPSGSGALAASSEADTWVSPRGPWNTSDNTKRKTSGSTSPNRTRDMQSFPDLSAPSSFAASRQTIGTSSGFPANRTKPGTNPDQPASSFKYGPTPGDVATDKENSAPYTPLARYDIESSLRKLRMDGRGAQEPGAFVSAGGHVSGNSSGHPGLDQLQNQAYDELYGVNQVSAAHGYRPSVQPAASFPTQQGGLRGYGVEEELHDRLRRSFTVGDATDAASSSYQPQPRPFQFNPGSVPWDANTAGSLKGAGPAGAVFMPEHHAETIMPGYASAKRGSIAERGSPVANLRSTLTSPRHMSDTPPIPVNPWSRPASRDPRNGMEAERRGSANSYMLHASQLHQPGHPTFYPPQGFYPPSISPYQPQLYDPYSATAFRQPLHFAGPGVPYYPPYMPNGSPAASRHHKDQDAQDLAQSKLLTEFRSSNKSNKRYELKDIYGYVVEFSGDQQGSRFIQQKLETANSDEKDQVFREIEPNAVQLMKDVFGNYVIQKFFEHGNQVQKKILAAQMKGKMVDLSTQMYACRVVQKALEHVLVEQQGELVKELEPEIVRTMKDQNGNHVVQKVIELVPRQYIGFIMESVRGQVSQLSSHCYGCRVVQRMMEHGSEADKAAIMGELHKHTSALITDPYGNYVVQHIISHGKPEDRRRAIDVVMAQVVTFSKHKFASNIVEKCVIYGTEEDRGRIRELLTRAGPDGTSPLQQMMKDQYANYVVQKLLEQLKGAERQSFVEEMKPQFNSLKKVSNGRQIAAIDRLITAASGTDHDAGETSGMQVDVSSSAPTPVLTMEPNTPQSSSPPSTNAGATDDIVDETGSNNPKAATKASAEPCPELRVHES